MRNKDYLISSNTPRDTAKKALYQGGIVFTMGVVATLFTVISLDMVWLPTVLVAIGGLFRLLYGVIVYLTGME